MIMGKIDALTWRRLSVWFLFEQRGKNASGSGSPLAMIEILTHCRFSTNSLLYLYWLKILRQTLLKFVDSSPLFDIRLPKSLTSFLIPIPVSSEILILFLPKTIWIWIWPPHCFLQHNTNKGLWKTWADWKNRICLCRNIHLCSVT